MNPEHIELYQKLSKTRILKERFGEWKVGDIVYREKSNKREVIMSIHASMDPFDTNLHARCNPAHYIWLPPVFDPERPERCLLGMLNQPFTIETKGDAIAIYDNKLREFREDRLDIALIKTILRQEGGEKCGDLSRE